MEGLTIVSEMTIPERARGRLEVVSDAINRTAGKHPILMCVAVFMGCVIDAVVFFRG